MSHRFTGSPLNQRRLDYLRSLIRRGGVGWAVRRIIFNWQGIFTSPEIRRALRRQFPLLEPAPGQIEDIIESLEQRGHFESFLASNTLMYRRAERRAFVAAVCRKFSQLKFNWK